MRGGQERQPLDVPLDGRVSNDCVFARMPGVFEPCTRLDHLGWLRCLASQARFLVASDRSQVARRRVRLDLGDLGIIEHNSTRARTSLVPKPLPSCDAFASDRPHSAYSWIGFFFPPSVPASKSNVRLGIIGSPFSIAMYGVTNSCAKTLGKYCSCTSASVGRASSPPHHSTI